jgi:hypothetical protein
MRRNVQTAKGRSVRKEPPVPADKPEPPEGPLRRVSKKDQIIGLFTAGITDVEDIALITHSRPSYVASVLQEAELLTGYFDLYTTSARPMNVYSKFFAKKLGYKDEEAARGSVEMLDHYYRQFQLAEDRAGQHHVLLLALTMYDRARWINKTREADVYRRWLIERLSEQPVAGARSRASEEQTVGAGSGP